MTIKPHNLWMEWLSPHFQTASFRQLMEKLKTEPQDKVYPPVGLRYSALTMNPNDVKVVILGQDPYHGPGQAMGLAFSVPPGVDVPPSLVNMYKEIESTEGKVAKGRSGDLTPWVNQGVLLLNTALSVRAHEAGSHRGWGWEGFTDGIIQELATRQKDLVFLLWGKHAQEKERLVPHDRGHLILKAPHPSPLSAHRGFLGSKHFQQANQFLIEKGKAPIDW